MKLLAIAAVAAIAITALTLSTIKGRTFPVGGAATSEATPTSPPDLVRPSHNGMLSIQRSEVVSSLSVADVRDAITQTIEEPWAETAKPMHKVVSGRVIDQHGVGIAGALVSDYKNTTAFTRTGSGGEFLLPVSKDTTQLLAKHDSDKYAPAIVSLAADARAELLIVLWSDLAIAGKVIDATGAPLSRFFVVHSDMLTHRTITAATRPDGTFTLKPLQSGDNLLLFGSLDSNSYSLDRHQTVARAPSNDAILVVPDGGAVILSLEGDAIGGLVTWLDAAGNLREDFVTADPHSSGPIAAGVYSVSCAWPDCRMAVRSGIVVTERHTTEFSLQPSFNGLSIGLISPETDRSVAVFIDDAKVRILWLSKGAMQTICVPPGSISIIDDSSGALARGIAAADGLRVVLGEDNVGIDNR